mmetsp:Transcript_35943/g.89728  ORF Transcript_35943/g.89728 Transcript_35943/m.89728 type:complete len:341 (-) Transcript_35943:54-1076(-)
MRGRGVHSLELVEWTDGVHSSIGPARRRRGAARAEAEERKGPLPARLGHLQQRLETTALARRERHRHVRYEVCLLAHCFEREGRQLLLHRFQLTEAAEQVEAEQVEHRLRRAGLALVLAPCLRALLLLVAVIVVARVRIEALIGVQRALVHRESAQLGQQLRHPAGGFARERAEARVGLFDLEQLRGVEVTQRAERARQVSDLLAAQSLRLGHARLCEGEVVRVELRVEGLDAEELRGFRLLTENLPQQLLALAIVRAAPAQRGGNAKADDTGGDEPVDGRFGRPHPECGQHLARLGRQRIDHCARVSRGGDHGDGGPLWRDPEGGGPPGQAHRAQECEN